MPEAWRGWESGPTTRQRTLSRRPPPPLAGHGGATTFVMDARRDVALLASRGGIAAFVPATREDVTSTTGAVQLPHNPVDARQLLAELPARFVLRFGEVAWVVSRR